MKSQFNRYLYGLEVEESCIISLSLRTIALVSDFLGLISRAVTYQLYNLRLIAFNALIASSIKWG